MISDQVIRNCIEEVKTIAGIEIAVLNIEGTVVAATSPAPVSEKAISGFIGGDDDEAEADGKLLLRIKDDDETVYVLVSDTDAAGNVSARLAAAQLKNLITAYKDRIDRNSFFQDLLLDNLLLVDIYNRARKLHVEPSLKRCVYVIEPAGTKDPGLMEMVRELFFTEAGDHVTAVDENHIIVIKAVPDDGEDALKETADMLIEMARSEAMSDVRVAYGTVTDDIKGVSASYKEARMALEVSRIFYPLKRCIEYGNLGVGRLIYQLPVNLCRLFIKEIFGDDIPEEIDDEILTTVNRFFDNSLNVSETSRQLFIHRNTLIYRIEKLQKLTGLDIRVFDDALTLKIALMVVNYLKYAGTSDKEE